MMMSNALKEIAVQHQIFMMSSTQTITDWSGHSFRGVETLRGSRAIADKIDFGSVSTKIIAEDDVEKLNIIMDSMPDDMPRPNLTVDIYKNRSGEYTDVRIYRYFDYGTCSVYDCFLTTRENMVETINYQLQEERPRYFSLEELQEKGGGE